jgi:hypothetical protein
MSILTQVYSLLSLLRCDRLLLFVLFSLFYFSRFDNLQCMCLPVIVLLHRSYSQLQYIDALILFLFQLTTQYNFTSRPRSLQFNFNILDSSKLNTIYHL